MNKRILLIAGLSTCFLTTIFCEINFSSTESTIDLTAGSSLILGNDLTGWNGTLVKDPDATITGSSISFSNGVYSDGSQDIKFSGTYNQDGSVTLANSAVMDITKKTDLTQTLTFKGSCTLNGNGNTINLAGDGKIIVQSGSSLIMKNLVLKGVGNGNIFCMDNSGTLSFQNVTIYQSTDYTFSIGHIDIIGNLNINGGYKFNYKSSRASTITSDSVLFLDRNVTFSYDPGIMSKDLIIFENEFSTLQLSGATLHTTLTGMNLTKGNLVVDRVSYISTEKTNFVDEGITLGDNLGNDCTCQILSGSKLELKTGSLKYKNTLDTSWLSENPYSTLQIDVNCNFYLYQNLNIGAGQINFPGYAGLHIKTGKNLYGAVNTLGALNYVSF